MKKTVLILFVVCTLILALPSLSFAQNSKIHVNVNGEAVNFDAAPFIENNVTYVPVRGVFEKLGAKVVWKNNTKEIIVYKGRTVLVLILNNRWTVINDGLVNANATPKIVNSKAFVPIRLISENLGATVTWNQQTQTINIVQNPVDDSGKSLLPLYYLKDRITRTESVSISGTGMEYPDKLLVYQPSSEEGIRLADLEAQQRLLKDQIIAAKEGIENDKKHIIDGSGTEDLLAIDEENLKQLEPKLVSVTEELKKFEESILKTVSTL
ncbi:copper amine oxidase N-terminal domain-containing protein [Aminipila terrae]|uniref:Copper amine oxidase-like N-terminal domain-containing protein n=1 Tax=Aminipila terrae TaxID=2697030 RepID=A0A6P1MNN9_9FIRM|nr:copper amine oxidase N-terminal domain-containing protein [Aminipila terrae]QHI73718.1 hypothetical protein Ami3637_16230 [Aminipila terrae]